MQKTFTILLLLFTTQAEAQSKRANIWYFGQNAGLDFNSGEPDVLTDGQINTDEGSAVICDENGNLLFYTDGDTIWNRNHEIMPNGTGLKGSFTSTQTALIVPQPGMDRLYYVFTTAEQGNLKGFNYNVIDMFQDNGSGDVVIKNVQLYTPTTEKLTAVHHANGRDIWVISHKWESDEFYTYLITEEGLIEEPVISKTGSRHEFNTGNAIGQMKVSPNGNILALNLWDNLFTEVFTFNDLTGEITFLKQFKIQTSLPGEGVFHISGLEISPNEKFLFIAENASEGFPGQNIYQIDLEKGSQTSIAEVFIGAHIQLGPDGKIYIVNTVKQELLVIERPNLPYNHLDFEITKLSIAPGTNILGLPNYIQSYFRINDPNLDLPNVFTPNNDGLNENFSPILMERVETFTMKIIDRTGKVIFQTKNKENWWNGGNYPVGVYFWHLKVEGVNGKNQELRGWVQLLR